MTYCDRCGGPGDDLHTRRECDDLAGLNNLLEGQRCSAALIAGLIAHSSHPLVVVARLQELGLIGGAS